MSGVSLLLIEFLISGVVIGFAVREVIATRRLLREHEEHDGHDEADAGDPIDGDAEARPAGRSESDSRA